MRQAFRQLDDPDGHSTCTLEHDRLIDRSARQNIWRVLARDLSGRKRLRDARRVDRNEDLRLLFVARAAWVGLAHDDGDLAARVAEP